MLDGGSDDDRLDGGAGADQLMGEAGDDRLMGGEGPDACSGRRGRRHADRRRRRDWLGGGEGADVFRFAAGNSARRAHDLIADFEPGMTASTSRPSEEGSTTSAPPGRRATQERSATSGGILSVDLDGDGAPDLAIAIAGAPALGPDDLVL